jgi:hypothetical protein
VTTTWFTSSGYELLSNTVENEIRSSVAPTATLNPTSGSDVIVGDLVIVTTWTVVTTNGVPTHTLQSGFTSILNEAVDSTTTPGADGRLSVAWKIATVAGAQGYQAYTASTGTSYTGLHVIKAGTFDANAPVAYALSTSTPDTATDPDPPNLQRYGDHCTYYAVGGWHLTASALRTVTPPVGYTEIWELAGLAAAEVSTAYMHAGHGYSLLTADTNNYQYNPPAFTGATGTVDAWCSGTYSIRPYTGAPVVRSTAQIETPTSSPTSPSNTLIDDLVIVITYSRHDTDGVPTHTIQAGFTEILSTSLDDGTLDSRLSVAYKVATADGANTYGAYSVTGDTATHSTIVTLAKNTYSTTGIGASGNTDTSTSPPTSPALTSTFNNSTAILIGAWHRNGPVLTIPPGAAAVGGSNISLGSYSLISTGGTNGMLGVATRISHKSGTSEGGAWGDNTAPDSTIGMTLIFPPYVAPVVYDPHTNLLMMGCG